MMVLCIYNNVVGSKSTINTKGEMLWLMKINVFRFKLVYIIDRNSTLVRNYIKVKGYGCIAKNSIYGLTESR